MKVFQLVFGRAISWQTPFPCNDEDSWIWIFKILLSELSKVKFILQYHHFNNILKVYKILPKS